MTDDVRWGRTRAGRSWHIVDVAARSRCGRRLELDTIRDDRPGDEATCESCYRIAGPR